MCAYNNLNLSSEIPPRKSIPRAWVVSGEVARAVGAENDRRYHYILLLCVFYRTATRFWTRVLPTTLHVSYAWHTSHIRRTSQTDRRTGHVYIIMTCTIVIRGARADCCSCTGSTDARVCIILLLLLLFHIILLAICTILYAVAYAATPSPSKRSVRVCRLFLYIYYMYSINCTRWMPPSKNGNLFSSYLYIKKY